MKKNSNLMSLNSLALKNLVTATAVTALCLGAAAAMAQDKMQADFPELSTSYLKEGAFIAPQQVQRVELGIANSGVSPAIPGMSKNQVRLELGNPHFNEGIFNNKVWNYALNFYTHAATGQGDNGAYRTCQFQVKFNDDDRVASTHWKDADCAALVSPPVTKPIAVEPAGVAPTQSGDGAAH